MRNSKSPPSWQPTPGGGPPPGGPGQFQQYRAMQSMPEKQRGMAALMSQMGMSVPAARQPPPPGGPPPGGPPGGPPQAQPMPQQGMAGLGQGMRGVYDKAQALRAGGAGQPAPSAQPATPQQGAPQMQRPVQQQGMAGLGQAAARIGALRNRGQVQQ